MTASANGTLAQALLAFQAEPPRIERSKTVKVKTKTGGEYTFAYAPLEAILVAIQPGLTKNGLAVSQLLSSIEGGRPSLRTVLLHASGETLEAEFPLPIGGHESAQEIGSLISYMRRYGVVSLLGLATEEDDDGNHASGNTAKVQPPKNAKAETKAEPESTTFEQPPSTVSATGPQRKAMFALSSKLLELGVLNESQEATIKAAAEDEGTTKAAASKVLDRLKQMEKESDLA